MNSNIQTPSRLFAAILAGAIIFSFSCTFADVPASAYIQNGLAVQFDGIDNAGTGTHDSSTTAWKDLVSANAGKYDMTLTAYGSFTDNALAANGSKTAAKGVSPDVSIAHIEGCFTLDSDKTANSALYVSGLTADDSMDWVIGLLSKHRGYLFGGKSSMFSVGDDYRGLHTVSSSKSVCYYDGSADAVTESEINYFGVTAARQAGTSAVGGFGDGDTPCAVKMHSIRLYNRALTEAEAACNANIDRVRFNGADPSTLTWPEGWQFEDGSLFRNVKIRVRCGSGEDGYGVGGTISISGGEALTGTAMWRECNSSATVQLSATAAEGYEFVGWLGVSDDIRDNAEIETAIYEDVTAVFRIIAEAAPRDYTWVGESGGVWDDNQFNWQDADGYPGVPAAGDTVIIPSSAKITLTNSTPALASVAVSGTITFTNWMTRLNATNVTVMSGGVLTCAGPFIPGEMSNRVWVVCTDLDLLQGGRIHADARGYKGGDTVHKNGYGPGAIPGDSYLAAGGHGGLGSYAGNSGYPPLAVMTNEYGCASAPVTPGSGGWGGNGNGGAGGGVVTIEASGCVSVYGSATADGGASGSTSQCAAGSGGSVFITCRIFQGAYGKVSARGGEPDRSYAHLFHAGGGGRVAILFDKVEQAELPCPEGMYYGSDTGGFLGPNADDFTECLPGSLYFSSDTLIDRTGATLFGKLDFADVTDKWTVDTIRLTNGWVMMARDDVEVEVIGDFELTGDSLVYRRHNKSTGGSSEATRGSRWDIGGATLYYATNYPAVSRKSSVTPVFSVGGDLKISDHGLLYLISSEFPFDPAADTQSTTNLGARLTVTGAIDLSDIGKIYLRSHPRTGASPCISAASLSVDEASWIDANDAGYFGRNTADYKNVFTRSFAPSVTGGKNGGGHGGRGGGGRTSPNEPGAAEFDSLDWPLLCGGAGNTDYTKYFTPLGGGVIRLFITGEVKLDGILRANATAIRSFAGSGAGGTVLVSCDHMVGEGFIQAKGANGYQYGTNLSSGHNSGAGGGGRIAVHYDSETQSNVTCAVTVDIAGGMGVNYGAGTGNGVQGTAWFTDDSIAFNGKKHVGRLYVPERVNFIREESLVMENELTIFDPGGSVEIEKDLTIRGTTVLSAGLEIPQGNFSVGGDLVVENAHIIVTGDNAKPRVDRFRVDGNLILNNATISVECSDEDRDQVVSIGGSIVMTNASTITLKSPCAEIEGEPGMLFTAQKLRLYEDCWIYPWSHNTNGASVLMRIAEIRCVADSGINASTKGYGRTTLSGEVYGPVTTQFNGAGKDAYTADGSIAPGHGGFGGSCLQVSAANPRGVGLAFDDYRRPVFAGPGSTCNYYNGGVPPRGGGVIRIESTFFDLGGGTLAANGSGATFRTGSAGGSIYVIADRFFGNGGTLSANGGNGGYYGFSEKLGNHKDFCMQGGGGGRIAVYFKNSAEKAMDVTTSVTGGICSLDLETSLNTYGEDLTELKAARTAQDGTVYWKQLPVGLRVIVK